MIIEVGQYRGKSWVSKAIKWQTFGVHSHTAIRIDDQIIEAWQGSNEVRVIKDWGDGHKPGTRVDIYDVELSDNEADKFAEFMFLLIGKGYDFRAIAGIMLRLKWLAKADEWFCSEAFAAALKHAISQRDADKIPPPHKVDPNIVPILPRVYYKTSLMTQ